MPAQGLSRTTALVTDGAILIAYSWSCAGQKGAAVLESGTWKVSLASFCGLLTLQNGGKAVAGCPSA